MGWLSREQLYLLPKGNNHRVLRFDNAAGKPNGANADGVLGQPDFASNTQALPKPGWCFRYAFLLIREVDCMSVKDLEPNRVLIFTDAANKLNGGPADFVFGQPDFTTQSSAPLKIK